jgi:hypothetical protein
MAAMMSRDLAFSPLAIVDVGDARSGWVSGRSGEFWASAGADGVVTGGGVFSDAGGSAVLWGGESNSVDWFRDDFSRPT